MPTKHRTQQEVDAEIAALKALKPTKKWKAKTEGAIKAAIEELEHGWDDTAEEYNELPDDQQDIIMTARYWKEGDSDEKPSEGWGGLVE